MFQFVTQLKRLNIVYILKLIHNVSQSIFANFNFEEKIKVDVYTKKFAEN